MLPSTAVEGLNTVQIDMMRETTFIVRNNFRIAGECLRSSAEELVKLKSIIPRGSWMNYLKSGCLPIHEKQARDLVTSWEKWLKDTPLTDGDLAYISSRTLAKVANADPATKEKVAKKLKSGEKVTASSMKELAGDMVISSIRNKKASVEELVKLTEKCEELEAENKSLKARIKELEGELAKV